MQNALIAQQIFNTPLLIHPGKLDAIIYGLQERFGIAANKPAPGMYTTQQGEHKKAGYRVVGGVAILDIFGVLSHRGGIDADSSYILGYQTIARWFEGAVADASVHTILLNMETPGGSVAGAFDLSDLIFEARGKKPIVAIAADGAMSAGYLIGSAADKFITTRTAYTGSIGVVMSHADFSKHLDNEGVNVTHIFAGSHKVDGNPYEALPADVRDHFQKEINTVYEMFVETVARNRGMEAQAVRDTEAQVYMGLESVAIGLTDGVSTPDKEISRLNAEKAGAGSRQFMINKETEMSDEEKGKDPKKVETSKTASEPAATAEGGDTVVTLETGKGDKDVRAEERARFDTVMNSDAAKGRTKTAQGLLVKTDMAATDIIEMLGDMPVEAKGASKLDAAMSTEKQPGIGADAGGETEMSESQRILKNHAAATGRKRS